MVFHSTSAILVTVQEFFILISITYIVNKEVPSSDKRSTSRPTSWWLTSNASQVTFMFSIVHKCIYYMVAISLPNVSERTIERLFSLLSRGLTFPPAPHRLHFLVYMTSWQWDTSVQLQLIGLQSLSMNLKNYSVYW